MFSAAILIGGQATRFAGRDKSALVVGGQTILERQLAVLGQVAGDVMLVGGTPRELAAAATRHVPDLVPGRGPLGGVHAALSAAHGEATAILACDMPFVTADLVAHLLSLADPTHGPDIVVPRTERGYHPLCAVYTRACLEPVARKLARGELTMTGVFDQMRVRVIGASELAPFGDPERLLANVNTSTEYRAIASNGMQS